MGSPTDSGYLQFSDTPAELASAFADLHGVPGPVPPIEKSEYIPSYGYNFTDGVEMTMEEAKRRFCVVAATAQGPSLKVTKVPLPDSGVESSAELQLASSSSSDAPQIRAAQNDETRPLLPNSGMTSSMTRMGRLRRRVQRWTQSWFFLPILMLLLVYPIAYMYIGGVFFEQCKNLRKLPLLFVSMGVSGSVAALTRVFSHVAVKLQRPEANDSFVCTLTGLIAIITFIGLYLVGIGNYINVDYKKHEECKLFLTLTMHSFWLTPLIGMILLFIYCILSVPESPIL